MSSMQKGLLIFLFLQVQLLFGQTGIRNFIKQNTIPISTIDPDSNNYSDLKILGEAIGNSQIVLLGEQDHGDAATFQTKTRIIKYLHEKKGYNIIAFESDFFGLNYKQYKEIDTSFLKNNLLSLWAYCNACNDLLYNYIPSTQQTNSPIQVTGLDNQMVYPNSRKYLINFLDSILQINKFSIIKQDNYSTEILPALKNLVTQFGYQLSHDNTIKCENYLQTIKSQSENILTKNSFESILIDNLISFNQEEKNINNAQWEAESIRDKQMYLNLKWLIQNKYPNQKIIIWAANNHIANYKNEEGYVTMGNFLLSDSLFYNKMYSLAFTSSNGESGRLWEKSYLISKPKDKSLESWINDSLQYAFINFNLYNKINYSSKESFYMRGWRYWERKEEWNKIFNGVLYIRKMFPCEK